MTEVTDEVAAVDTLVRGVFDDMKAENPIVLDVRGRTAITDLMALASGRSHRHVQSIADRVQEVAKAQGYAPRGIEGAGQGDWVLVDLGYAVVHIMLPETRDFYRLENIWGLEEAAEATGSAECGSDPARRPPPVAVGADLPAQAGTRNRRRAALPCLDAVKRSSLPSRLKNSGAQHAKR